MNDVTQKMRNVQQHLQSISHRVLFTMAVLFSSVHGVPFIVWWPIRPSILT